MPLLAFPNALGEFRQKAAGRRRQLVYWQSRPRRGREVTIRHIQRFRRDPTDSQGKADLVFFAQGLKIWFLHASANGYG